MADPQSQMQLFNKTMTHILSVFALAPTLVALSLATPAGGGIQSESPSQRSVTRTIIDREARNLFGLVAQRTLENNGEIVVAFSSKAPPAWAANSSALDAFFGAAPNHPGKSILESYGRAWTYRVPASAVGKSWDSLKDTDVIIEIVGAPSYITVEGVMKSGLKKRKPTMPPPAP